MAREINEEDKIMQVNVYCLFQNGTSTSLLVFLKGLYKLAVNDTLRSDIYFKHEAKNSLKSFLLKGNEIEQKFTLRLLCQLTFNRQIAQEIAQDNELMDYLNKGLL